MKIIFLDIDGVLALFNDWTKRSKEYHPTYFYPFNKKCVGRLNEIIIKTNSQIVFSSAWRTSFNHTLGNIDGLFKHNGIIRTPIDVTPYIPFVNRGIEIAKWLSENKYPERFVILDDMDIIGFPKNFIRCNPTFGITDRIKNLAIEHLNN